jgi:hypothetical protein
MQAKLLSYFSDMKYIYLLFIQDGHCIGPTVANEPEPLLCQNSITRKAGGKKAPEKEMQVMLMIVLLVGRLYALFLFGGLLKILLLQFSRLL